MGFECDVCGEEFAKPHQKIVGRGPVNADNNTASDIDTEEECPFCGSSKIREM